MKKQAATVMGLVVLGMGQITAQEMHELQPNEIVAPNFGASTWTTTTHCLVFAGQLNSLYECFDGQVPPDCQYTAEPPPNIGPCTVWRHTFEHVWCCPPCPPDFSIHFSYWIRSGPFAGQYIQIGEWTDSNPPGTCIGGYFTERSVAGGLSECRIPRLIKPSPTPKP